VVYGAGGHGSVVADAARSAGFDVLGFLDDRRAVGEVLRLGSVLGGSGWWRQHPLVGVVPAVGDNAARKRLVLQLSADGIVATTIIHPSSVVSTSASLQPGVVVLALAVVNTGAQVGLGAIINSGAIVEHDVSVGDFAHVSPNATLAGGAVLGALSHLGAGACVLPGVKVGQNCVVGAGAVVTREIPAGSVCTGIPARVKRTSG
jgi:UDP-N-acetylbacillosamine N-acetyltransferase